MRRPAHVRDAEYQATTKLTVSTVGKRDDFTSKFIHHDASDGTPMAAIDWDAAVTALASGGIPCSGGERRVLLLSASLAGGIPVDLRDAVTGLDHDNTARLLVAIRHAAGKRSENSGRQ